VTFFSRLWKHDFTEKARDKAAETGAAMSDGSFPIYSQKDLDNASALKGMSHHPESAVVAHMRQRAKALDLKMPGEGKRKEKAK
jgi:hypothetical protein